MRPLLLSLACLLAGSTSAQMPVGIFTLQDIGEPAQAGSSSYHTDNQSYTLQGGGYNVWFERDECAYLHRELEGDFILTAEFAFEGEGKDPHRKTGWMVRQSSDAQAAHVTASLHGDGLTLMQWRPLRGAFMRDPEDQHFAPKRAYPILQLERQGTTFIMRAAHPGEPLQEIGRQTVASLSGPVLAGLFVSAHDPEALETARIWNVRIDQPAPSRYDAYEDGRLPCRLETIDVFSRERRVIHHGSEAFEAPNWHPDGQKLLINMEGSIYQIPVAGGAMTQLNTGFADRNNNDHGISFDGQSLAISHHREGLPEGGSTIYVLPLEGGKPRLVTEATPSYWHGWAPNNKEVVFVGKRPHTGDSYHIFRADIKTGKETQLTDFEGSHVDGPEYSPDGQYIYYNGNQSGTMQIWRMRPDGTGHEQLTFDAYNDWFPHISPDGKWMVFLSFPETIDVDAHPFYKRVLLRMMPVSGGAPQVIAYLYGGQGTINVPSWSPDSRRVAFVSNAGWVQE
ncbi:MAG: hypothetical protein D6722_16265 [Bacteroidetes bacterium]|nr:MAG: hypothetical protein D6722_16265 [Bacteroidota bacterium]